MVGFTRMELITFYRHSSTPRRRAGARDASKCMCTPPSRLEWFIAQSVLSGFAPRFMALVSGGKQTADRAEKRWYKKQLSQVNQHSEIKILPAKTLRHPNRLGSTTAERGISLTHRHGWSGLLWCGVTHINFIFIQCYNIDLINQSLESRRRRHRRRLNQHCVHEHRRVKNAQ